MIRTLALLFAAVTMLAGAGGAQAGAFDMRDILGGGPNYRRWRLQPDSAANRELCRQLRARHHFDDTAERRLYLVLPNGQALRYGVGVGRDSFRWGGVHRISTEEGQAATPPSQMLAQRPDLPRHVAGGIDDPLGARAMYLGSTLPASTVATAGTIGQAVSSGCFHMTNEDVTDLYSRSPSARPWW